MFNKKKEDTDGFDKYTYILKIEKMKLHCIYIACICIGISLLIVINSAVGDDIFIGKLELASTITSIILSVIAIIMSISGEGKTEGIRNQMTEIIKDFKNTVDLVNTINADVKSSIDELQDKIDNIPSKVDEIYKRRSDGNIRKRSNSSLNSKDNTEWSRQ